VSSIINGSISAITQAEKKSNGFEISLVEQHSKVLKSEREFWKKLASYNTCFLCLSRRPNFKMTCRYRHTICSSCIKILGQPTLERSRYQHNECVLCGGTVLGGNKWTEFYLKPTEAGPRVLAIDGGGVRGTVSARILQLLEEEIGIELPIFHFFDLILGTSSGRPNKIRTILESDIANRQIGGIIALGLGMNFWSARDCVEKFKSLAKDAFQPLHGANIPIFGWIISFIRDSFYDANAMEKALRGAFTAPNQLSRFLFHEPLLSVSPDTGCRWPVFRDLKVGVTAVTADSEKTFLMTNYNREAVKDSEDSK
jgi:hypothetical protein